MPAETAERITFDQAHEKAKETLAQTPETPPEKAVEAPVAGDTKEGEPQQAEETEKAPDQPLESAESEELLSSEEQAKLTAEQKKTYKAMQKAYTQKTQKLSAKLKETESLSELAEYRPLIDSFKANPQETLKNLAKHYGFNMAEAKQEPKAETIDPAVQNAVEQMRKAFGPDGEPLADQLAPIMHELARSVAQSVMDTGIKPIKQQQDEITYKTVAAETDVEMKSFEKGHPDWKQHEPAMLKLSQTIVPATGAEISASEYLELLYTIATKDQRAKDATTDVVKKLNAVVKASEPPDSGVKDQNITPASPKRPTIEQAFEAAKKGIKW